VAKHDRNLPHWEQEGRTYFVTFRLADSLPQEKLRQWVAEREQWSRAHPEPHTDAQRAEYEQLFTERMQEWLDAGSGECWLAGAGVARVIETTLRHFEGERYRLGAFVIMPNHVHVLVTPLGGSSIVDILHSWKSYSANQINQLLDRQGTVWQSESFDHIVRNEDALSRFEEYIRENPARAGLRRGEYIYGSAAT
jgi:REP element-mobilizing transposase RayT